jgi:SAM-dependent methyltransferase
MKADDTCLKHAMPEDGTTPYVYGNVYDKYNTKNPVARRLMQGFLEAVCGFVVTTGATEIHEVGCGEGHLGTILARQGLQVRGSDGSSEVIEIAKEESRQSGFDIPFRVASIYDLNHKEDAAELVLCCEVLEHLEEPERALEVLKRIAAPYLIASVPREPLWRVLNMMRGKYWPALGNTPGHLQHWSRPAFLHLLAMHFDIINVASPLPWTVALCRNRTPVDI